MPRNDPEPPGLDLRELAALIWRHRLRIAATCLAAALLALGAAMVLPRWYRATAVILPPEETDLLRNMALGQRALTKFPSFGILSEYFTPADVYQAILNSRTVKEEVVHEHDLQRVYRQRSLEKTVRELTNLTKVRLNPQGTIQISVEDRDPKRASAIANSFVAALDRFNVEKRNTQARRTRQFLEGRLRDTDSLLRTTEGTLRRYQERHHTVAPASFTAGDVQAASDLMARKVALEVRLGVLRSYLREDNDQIIQSRSELEQLKRRIATLPALQTDIARLTRDSKVAEQLYLLLTAELEQARIREQQDTPTVQVLDTATPPERHARPRRLILMAAAVMLAFTGSVIFLWMRGAPRPVLRLPEGRSA
jgi:uncharacterized protein involved in exopolysaccharide biosynthesis